MTDGPVTIDERENTVRPSHAAWNELGRLERAASFKKYNE
jgi:hypothetical protein